MSSSTFNLAANNVLRNNGVSNNNNNNNTNRSLYNPITGIQANGNSKQFNYAQNLQFYGNSQSNQVINPKSAEKKQYGDILRQQIAQKQYLQQQLQNPNSQSLNQYPANNSLGFGRQDLVSNAPAFPSMGGFEKLSNVGYGTFPNLQSQNRGFPGQKSYDNPFIPQQNSQNNISNGGNYGFSVPNQISDHNGYGFQSSQQILNSKPMQPLNFSKPMPLNGSFHNLGGLGGMSSGVQNQNTNLNSVNNRNTNPNAGFLSGFNPRIQNNNVPLNENVIPPNIKVRGRLQRQNDLENYAEQKQRKQIQLKQALQEQIQYKQKLQEIEKRQRKIEDEIYDERVNKQRNQSSLQQSKGQFDDQRIDSLQSNLTQKYDLDYEMKRVKETKLNLKAANQEQLTRISPDRNDQLNQSHLFNNNNYNQHNNSFDKYYEQRIRSNQAALPSSQNFVLTQSGSNDVDMSGKKNEIDLMRDYYSFQQKQFENQMNSIQRDMLMVSQSKNQAFNDMLLLRDKAKYNNVMSLAYPEQLKHDKYYSALQPQKLNDYINGAPNQGDKAFNQNKIQKQKNEDRSNYDNDIPLHQQSEMIMPSGGNRFLENSFSGDLDERRQIQVQQAQQLSSQNQDPHGRSFHNANQNQNVLRNNSELQHDTQFQAYDDQSRILDTRSRSQRNFYKKPQDPNNLSDRAEVPAAPDLNDVYGRPHSSNQTQAFRQSQMNFQKVQQEKLNSHRSGKNGNQQSNRSQNQGDPHKLQTDSIYYNQEFDHQNSKQVEKSERDHLDNEIDQLMGNIGQLMDNLNNRDTIEQQRRQVLRQRNMRESGVSSLKLSAIRQNYSNEKMDALNSSRNHDPNNLTINESVNRTALNKSGEYPYKRLSIHDELDQLYLEQAMDRQRQNDRQTQIALGLPLDSERNTELNQSNLNPILQNNSSKFSDSQGAEKPKQKQKNNIENQNNQDPQDTSKDLQDSQLIRDSDVIQSTQEGPQETGLQNDPKQGSNLQEQTEKGEPIKDPKDQNDPKKDATDPNAKQDSQDPKENQDNKVEGGQNTVTDKQANKEIKLNQQENQDPQLLPAASSDAQEEKQQQQPQEKKTQVNNNSVITLDKTTKQKDPGSKTKINEIDKLDISEIKKADNNHSPDVRDQSMLTTNNDDNVSRQQEKLNMMEQQNKFIDQQLLILVPEQSEELSRKTIWDKQQTLVQQYNQQNKGQKAVDHSKPALKFEESVDKIQDLLLNFKTTKN